MKSIYEKKLHTKKFDISNFSYQKYKGTLILDNNLDKINRITLRFSASCGAISKR